MKDNDQHLLWEAYLEKARPAHDESKKDEDSEGKYDDGDGKKEKCDHVPCEEENVQEEETYGAEGIEGEGEGDDEDDVQEEMDTLEFQRDTHPGHGLIVFNALVEIIGGNMAGMDTPDHFDGFDLGKEFEDAKKLIVGQLQDITLSEVKAALQNHMDFPASSHDTHRDDSRLSDMSPREPGGYLKDLGL